MALERDTVITAALNLLDEVGLDNLTMRRLASVLEIKAASLYWHFESKQALMDGMADALMADVACEPPVRQRKYQDAFARVTRIAHEIRRALLARRDGARVYAGTYVVTDNVMRVAEAMICPLREQGATTRLASWSAFSILDYVLGFVMEEQGFSSSDISPSEMTTRRAAFEALAAQSYPHVAASMDDVFNLDFDSRFEL